MATISDLSGKPGATVQAKVDGMTLDLTKAEADELARLVTRHAEFVAAARKATKTTGTPTAPTRTRSRSAALATQTAAKAPTRKRAPRAGKAAKPAIKSNGAAAYDSAAIRKWATERGIEGVGDRGRIPAKVVDQYRAAHAEPLAEAATA